MLWMLWMFWSAIISLGGITATWRAEQFVELCEESLIKIRFCRLVVIQIKLCENPGTNNRWGFLSGLENGILLLNTGFCFILVSVLQLQLSSKSAYLLWIRTKGNTEKTRLMWGDVRWWSPVVVVSQSDLLEAGMAATEVQWEVSGERGISWTLSSDEVRWGELWWSQCNTGTCQVPPTEPTWPAWGLSSWRRRPSTPSSPRGSTRTGATAGIAGAAVRPQASLSVRQERPGEWRGKHYRTRWDLQLGREKRTQLDFIDSYVD